MYKKIYLEITNNCNLNCNFCIKNKRKQEFMLLNNFKKILNKLDGYTDYLYFHVLGEPLLHPNINEFINLASKTFKINITTNGYLINRINNNKNIRQINISLHSFDEKYNITLEYYLNNIFKYIDSSKNTYISLRLWTNNKHSEKILRLLNEKYNTNFTLETLEKNNKLKNRVYLNKEQEFIWPSLNNNYYNEEGSCYGLIDHIGILVDGTIIPCCLDSEGIINLGNIYDIELSKLKESKLCKEMIKGFKNNKKVNELCKKCGFLR